MIGTTALAEAGRTHPVTAMGADTNTGQYEAAIAEADKAIALAAATWLFPDSNVATTSRDSETEPVAASVRFASHQIVTIASILGLIVFVITGVWLGLEPGPISGSMSTHCQNWFAHAGYYWN